MTRSILADEVTINHVMSDFNLPLDAIEIWRHMISSICLCRTPAEETYCNAVKVLQCTFDIPVFHGPSFMCDVEVNVLVC